MNCNSSTETVAKCFWKYLITPSHPLVHLPLTISEHTLCSSPFQFISHILPLPRRYCSYLFLHRVINLFQSLEMKHSPLLLPQPSTTSCKAPLAARHPMEWRKTQHNRSVLGTWEGNNHLSFISLLYFNEEQLIKRSVSKAGVLPGSHQPCWRPLWVLLTPASGLEWANPSVAPWKGQHQEWHLHCVLENTDIFNLGSCVLRSICKICPKHSQDYGSKSLIKID